LLKQVSVSALSGGNPALFFAADGKAFPALKKIQSKAEKIQSKKVFP
jgi:hypothetical protein